MFAGVTLAAVPKVGSLAPGFSLPSSRGSVVALGDYIGKSNVVLVFYRGYW
jgi:peroxiredoxin